MTSTTHDPNTMKTAKPAAAAGAKKPAKKAPAKRAPAKKPAKKKTSRKAPATKRR